MKYGKIEKLKKLINSCDKCVYIGDERGAASGAARSEADARFRGACNSAKWPA